MTRHAGGGGRSRGYTEDGSRSPYVRVHARFADPEKIRDLLRRKTAGDRAEHLTLPIGQRFDRPDALAEYTPGNEIPGDDPDQHGSRALHSRCKRPRLAP